MAEAPCSLPDNEFIYRRIPAVYWPNPRQANSRPQLTAFLPRRDVDGLSVNVASMTSPEETANVSGKSYHVVRLSVGELRQRFGLDVQSDPLPDNPAHAIIPTINRAAYEADKPKMKALANQIIDCCEVVHIASEKDG